MLIGSVDITRFGIRLGIVLLLSCIGALQGCETAGISGDSKLTKDIQAASTPTATPLSEKAVLETDPLTDLKSKFRQIYKSSTQNHFETVIKKSPYITQDLLNMTLYLPDGSSVRYQMEKERYFLMAHSTHPAFALYAMLSLADFGTLSDGNKAYLKDYQSTIDAAILYIEDGPYSEDDKARAVEVLRASSRFITQLLNDGGASREQYETFVTPIKETINQNLYVGASEQLTQFRAQMEKWRAVYPNEDWSNLRVVLLGFHNPRADYALKLFFEWLLDEPDYEKRVVYAEYQFGFFGDKKQEGLNLAIELLTKVDFEMAPGQAIFNDPTYLQHDVMGPAAIGILKNWGPSSWPNRTNLGSDVIDGRAQ